MQELNEQLLSSWLRLTTTINNERIVSEMPYNEAFICNLLYRNQMSECPEELTATDLCHLTRMVKSQMNRTLNSMEEKEMILRVRSLQDKRHVYISLNMEKMDTYVQQHSKILELIDSMVEHFGKEKVMEIYNLFEEISDIAEELI